METLLLSVTAVSLAVATVMTIVAWRLLRRERQRSAQRIEALRTMARMEADAEAGMGVLPAAGTPDVLRHDERQTRRDRMRGAADQGHEWELPLRRASADETASDRLLGAAPHGHDGRGPDRELLHDQLPTRPAGGGSPVGRRWLIAATIALLVAAGLATASALRSPEIMAAMAASRPPRPASPAPVRPLELLSLRHTMTRSTGLFTVTGLVQNPRDGRRHDQVVAVAYLFDNQGRYFAGGRANIDQPVLGPGDGSPFVIAVPGATGVSRYRVGFRQQDGTVIQHVDRRGELPAGMTGTAVDETIDGQTDPTVSPAADPAIDEAVDPSVDPATEPDRQPPPATRPPAGPR